MSYDVVEHTADVRVVVEAATVEELFADALRGVMNVMSGGMEDRQSCLSGQARLPVLHRPRVCT